MAQAIWISVFAICATVLELAGIEALPIFGLVAAMIVAFNTL